MLDILADHHTACQVMDLVEEEDLEEMAVILEGKDEILAAMSESLVDNKGEKVAMRGGDQREEPGQGDQRVNLGENTLSRVGAGGDGGGLCLKVEGPAEGQETRPMAVDLTKKVTQSLEQAKCNIDTKQGISNSELKTASAPLENAEKKGVEEEEEERKTSVVRGKRMPAWVRRESVQWEKEMIMVSSRRESRTSIIPSELLTSSRFQIQSLDCERLKEKDNKEEDREVIKSSSISKMTKENEDGRLVSGTSEIKPGACYKDKEGFNFSETEETKGTTCCKEVEEEDFDFYKVEEKLTEWRRRRKSGREEDKDKDRVR